MIESIAIKCDQCSGDIVITAINLKSEKQILCPVCGFAYQGAAVKDQLCRYLSDVIGAGLEAQLRKATGRNPTDD